MAEDLYYVEMDGRVFLVRDGARLRFPTRAEVPCEIEEKVDLTVAGRRVRFATAKLGAWPTEWPLKDEVPGLENVDPVVHLAINASLVREVVGGIVLREDGHVLMVKSARGFVKGMWNMPGGFVVYGETPEEAVVRELAEEVGLAVRVERLLGVYSKRFASPYFMRGHVFLLKAERYALELNPDEIAEAEWMALDRAVAETLNPFARAAMEEIIGRRGGGPT